MSTAGKPNTIDLRRLRRRRPARVLARLSIAEFPKAKHLMDDAEHMPVAPRCPATRHPPRRPREMEQEYERHYDPSGRYLGGTIKYADGRTLHANTNGLGPSTIPPWPVRVHRPLPAQHVAAEGPGVVRLHAGSVPTKPGGCTRWSC